MIRRRKLTSATGGRARKISVDLPTRLYEEALAIVQERRVSTSVFVREAVEHYIEEIRQMELERQLEEGYLANAELSGQIHDEFAFVDAELS
ncbi:MAG: hypothetical protein JO061_11590 [Acidobacteriaceae bacterium]|nr:hypothetical protein [Acidobacteriaceae bacterium]